MKLTKEEYKVLYYISIGKTEVSKLSEIFNEADVRETLISLAKKGLVKVDYRNGEIHGFIETPIGKIIAKSEEYKDWLKELLV